MKVISWNIHGAKRPMAISELIFLRKKFCPDIVFVLETMTSNSNSSRICQKLGFDGICIVHPFGRSGGLRACWSNRNIRIISSSKTDRMIELQVEDLRNGETLFVYGIYAPAQESEKDVFWRNLTNTFAAKITPWLLIGDLNELLLPQDKFGGVVPQPSRFHRLGHFLNATNGIDVTCNGTAFSWKRAFKDVTVYERLDRAIVSPQWENIFPNNFIFYENFAISDHAPTILDTLSVPRMGMTPFRFQNSWAKDKESFRIVENQWRSSVRGTPMFKLTQKLKRVKVALKSWYRKKYDNIGNQLKKNSVKINIVENTFRLQPFNISIKKQLGRLISQREKLLLFNKKLWGKYNRQLWLTQGDSGSKFFHEKFKARKKKKCYL